MIEHTPGPWTRCGEDRGGCKCGYVFGHGGQVYVAQAIGERTIDRYLGPDPYPTNDVALANARLIAAAPKMLDLLRRMDRIGGLGHDAHDRIRAVIAEIEGSTHKSPENERNG